MRIATGQRSSEINIPLKIMSAEIQAKVAFSVAAVCHGRKTR
jgi:hypothetical protein